MQTSDDMQLLQQYANSQSEEAFAALVSRYINLVYSAALRQVRNPHQAEEVAQAVFVILAKKSRALRPGVILSGWLYQTARLVSANVVRGEARRRQREQEAFMQSTLQDAEPPSWAQIAPLLEEAMAKLGEKDRNAIVLRYFEGKEVREIAAALGSTEDAAKMRLSRAVEKLREFFVRRGLPISGVGLAAIISEFSVQAAPLGLAGSVTSGVCGGSALAASTLTLAKGTLTMMAWTKINLGIATVALAAVVYQWHEVSVANQKTADLQQQLVHQTELAQTQLTTLKELQESNAALSQQVESSARENARLAAPPAIKPPAVASAGFKAPAAGSGLSKSNLLAQMFGDPAMKQAMRDQQLWMTKKQYAAFVKQANLTPEQTDKFYGILSDSLSSNLDRSMSMLNGDAAAANAVKEAQAATDAQLQELLGDAGFAQYSEYKEGLTDRTLLDQMMPDFADNPLSKDQQKQLLAVMRAARNDSTHMPGQADPAPDPTDLAGSVEHAMEKMEQMNATVLQQAAGFLTPAQLQSLGTSQSNMLSLQKAGMAMAKKMFSGASNSGQ
ncbi:MAG TPA: sigma-70 family RNA polymerase sigma factor [Verrucomicrobiae bacterium]|jgi:RNA polymerase sigma factor (sigma-70 family)|nr:sigma-70 family RNA polymerase sigma factor [Verrucomicrobiae bacterium]